LRTNLETLTTPLFPLAAFAGLPHVISTLAKLYPYVALTKKTCSSWPLQWGALIRLEKTEMGRNKTAQ
jgi:hypothetical protein